MKRRLVELLRCPVCRRRLDLHVISESSEDVRQAVEASRCRSFCALHNVAVNGDSRKVTTDCQACYGRDVREGFLSCAGCSLMYPIIEGVPRIIRDAFAQYSDFFQRHRSAVGSQPRQEAAAQRLGRLSPRIFHRRSNESFSLQWEMYQYEDKTWFKDDLNLRRREFLYSMNLTSDALVGALVLDAGCGNGRLTGSVAGYGAEIVGMDLSRSVERAEKHRQAIATDRAPFVHFVQGNVLEPPFSDGAFDHIHTSGVLHHTPDPELAFRSFLRLGRPGGRAYVQLYRRREAWVRIINNFLRTFTCRLPVRFLYRLCYLMVPAHTAAILMIARLRGETSPIRQGSRRERAVSLFDHFSPRYQYRHTPDEVREMFERADLRHIQDVTLANEARHMVAFVAER